MGTDAGEKQQVLTGVENGAKTSAYNSFKTSMAGLQQSDVTATATVATRRLDKGRKLSASNVDVKVSVRLTDTTVSQATSGSSDGLSTVMNNKLTSSKSAIQTGI